MEFGDELARIRRERGLTQAGLGPEDRGAPEPAAPLRGRRGTADPRCDQAPVRGAVCRARTALLFADDPRALVENRLRMALETTIYLSEHEQAVIAEIIENFVAARVARERPNQRRGPSPRKSARRTEPRGQAGDPARRAVGVDRRERVVLCLITRTPRS